MKSRLDLTEALLTVCGAESQKILRFFIIIIIIIVATKCQNN